jgi:hypothetical protein
MWRTRDAGRHFDAAVNSLGMLIAPFQAGARVFSAMEDFFGHPLLCVIPCVTATCGHSLLLTASHNKGQAQ